MKSKVSIIDKNDKLKQFKKLDYLRDRWELDHLSLEQLKDYNKWTNIQRYTLILIELEFEHYLTRNIYIDLKDQEFEKDYKKIFSNRSRKSRPFIKTFDELKEIAEQKKIIPEHIASLSFGKKIIFWNALKSDIFNNKFFNLDIKHHNLLRTSLNNLRIIRNGIAHIESRDQMLSKLREVDWKDTLTNKRENKNRLIQIWKKDRTDENKERAYKAIHEYKQLIYKNSLTVFKLIKKAGK